MTVTQIDGQWFVTADDSRIAGPFTSNAGAWSWIDRRDPEHDEMVDTVARIRNAFMER